MVDSFTPNTDAEIAPAYTPEQEAQLIADGDIQQEQVQHPNAEAPQEELILGKFKSQEDLAAAYTSLEQRMSSQTPESGTISELMENAGEYYTENGDLSEQHYSQFEQQGISRTYVDKYISGISAHAEAETTKLFNTIGGQDNFSSMSEWMGENLQKTELEAYNNVVSRGSTEEVATLLQGMYSRYQASSGAGTTQLQGTVSSSPAGFRSRGEVMAAMDDPKYATDAAFRADVERKLSVTPNTVF